MPRFVAAVEAALAEALEQAAEEASPPALAPELRSVVNKLKALLASGDIEARDCFQGYRPVLAAGLGQPRVGRMQRQIDSFDFERALAELAAAESGPGEAGAREARAV